MLDSEPDNTNTANNTANNPSGGAPGQAAKPPRRRAASRPAGPPRQVAEAAEITVTAGTTQPVSQPELPAAQGNAEAAPARKTAARKSAAKKAPAKKAAAKKTTTRKAAATKTADEEPAAIEVAELRADTSAATEAGTPAKKTAAKRARKTATKQTDAKPTDSKPTDAGQTEAGQTDAGDAATKGSAKRPSRKTTAKRSAAAKSAGASTVAPEPAVEPVLEDDSISGVVGALDAISVAEVAGTAEVAEAIKAAQTAGMAEVPGGVEASEQGEAAGVTEAREVAEAIGAAEATDDAEEKQADEASELSIEAAIASAMSATLAQREAAQGDPADLGVDADYGTAESAASRVADRFQTVEPQEDQTAEEPTGESPVEDAEDSDVRDDGEGDENHEGGRRRRRRRGGRRRRRGRDRDSSDDEDSAEDSADASESTGSDGPVDQSKAGADEAASRAGDAPDADNSDGSDSDSSDSDSDDSSEDDADGGGRRRRRRRRRRGEDTAGAPDDPTEVVVRVREPRKASDEVTGIDGSTRMEAKRQRRREGREAGRRRAPIISEAEFLARRESVNRKMIIRQRDDLSQIAVLEDGILVEHYVDRASANSLIGNVYLGRVQNVLPSMEAAFIDIGRGRNAVLYAGEVDWDSFGAEGHDRKVENVLKSGQTVLVQVSKDPVGAKGARLTNHVSVPGRYVVYAPSGHLSGISRKLPENERKRLKDILDAAVGETASVIVRTAAEGASEDELTRDVNRLKAQWEDIERKVKSGNAPQLLYAEPDLTLRIVRDLFTEDFAELIVQGNGSASDAHDALEAYLKHVAPHLADRMKRWDADQNGDLFGSYRLDEQIAKGLERKVFLPSGGSLIIDRTEAMTVIDVNTGKFTGSGGNLEATITSNNLEAAEEIVRQLRLRDIGGIIVIDFIDMVLPSNRELLLRRLVECLGRDRTRHQVAEVTSLGLVQMTRKRIGTGLLEAFSTECPHCHGRGVELHDMPVADAKLADGGAREDHSGGGGGRNRRRGGKGRKGGDHGGNDHNNDHNDDQGGEKSSESAPAEVSAAS